jgi:hypothetical protein
MKIHRYLLAATGALALLCGLVASASAGRFSTSSQTWRATFREVRFSGGFGTTVCAITLEVSLHSRTIAKVANSLIGYVTRAATGNCTQGSATVLTATLPWHAKYISFTGTLPSIGSLVILIIIYSLQIREPVFGITCLFRSTEAEPVTGAWTREAGGALTSATLSGSIGTNCGASGTVEGRSTTLTVLNSASRITVTLI